MRVKEALWTVACILTLVVFLVLFAAFLVTVFTAVVHGEEWKARPLEERQRIIAEKRVLQPTSQKIPGGVLFSVSGAELSPRDVHWFQDGPVRCYVVQHGSYHSSAAISCVVLP